MYIFQQWNSALVSVNISQWYPDDQATVQNDSSVSKQGHCTLSSSSPAKYGSTGLFHDGVKKGSYASKSRQKVDGIKAAAGPAVAFLCIFFSNGVEQYKSKDYFIAVHFSKAIAPNGNTFM